MEGTTVRSFEHDAGRITGVVTDDGAITPGTVVVAAGAWTPSLLEGLGVDMPIFPMRLQIVQTEPMARRARTGPVRAGAL